MIISVEELKQYITTDKTDQVLEDMLQALELTIRSYTNNRFHQMPSVMVEADVVGGVFAATSVPFAVGDTVQVSYGKKAMDCGLYTIKEITGNTFTVNEGFPDIPGVKVCKVKYPADVKMGVVNMMTWELENRTKAGIQSETISRHTVNYINLDEWNSALGYPASLVQFLKPYMKARFGGGIGK